MAKRLWKNLITIKAATLQAATTGHAYWINADGTLLDAGTNIAAAAATDPTYTIDCSDFESEPSWSVFYGAQTGNVGGKLGMAEVWPTQPPEAATIPPYVRDVASHWLVTAGLGFVLQQRLPADVDVLYEVTSQTNTALDTGNLLVEDFDSLWYLTTSTAASLTLTIKEVNDAGTAIQLASIGGAVTSHAGAWGRAITALPSATFDAALGVTLPRRVEFLTNAIVGQTSYLRILGTRKTPLRRPSRIAPYIQWVNPGTGGAAPVVPTAASPLYLELSALI